jgi:hypothetical protein
MIFIGAIIIIVQVPQDEVESVVVPEADEVGADSSSGLTSGYAATCKKCGWTNSYDTTTKAKQALGAHSRFCQGKKWNVSPFARPI